MKSAFVITLIVGAVLFAAKNLLHLPERFPEGYVASSVLAMANLFFVKEIVIFFTSEAKKGILKVLLFIAGLLATVAGLCCVVAYKIGDPAAVVIGFTVILGVMLVNSYSLFKKYDNEPKEKQE
jgi:hypothetical protein